MMDDPRRAVVIAVGDELIAGDLADGNSGVIARAKFTDPPATCV